ncbi:MAG: TrkA family potassium uptake protein [Ruminococcaceae bacterium]|nr:TrkA family potassium uptake protein [Oscillospiraceae bacterium]
MNILIIGCGMVGSELAATLDMRGHDVSIIDRDESSFDLLPDNFSGFTTTGIPIEQEILKRAGIESCDALCAVTDNDNMNIMVSELANKVFGVKKVFARIRDISKAEIFESLGIRTVCTTNLIVSAACAALEEDTHKTSSLTFENHSVSFTTMDVPEEFIGNTPEDIQYEPGEVLFAVMRGSEMLMHDLNIRIEFNEGDKLIFAKKA